MDWRTNDTDSIGLLHSHLPLTLSRTLKLRGKILSKSVTDPPQLSLAASYVSNVWNAGDPMRKEKWWTWNCWHLLRRVWRKSLTILTSLCLPYDKQCARAEGREGIPWKILWNQSQQLGRCCPLEKAASVVWSRGGTWDCPAAACCECCKAVSAHLVRAAADASLIAVL